MSMQLKMWQTDLERGKDISLQVTGSLLEPTLSQGDSVAVRYVPYSTLKVADIVFCILGGKASLRKVSQSRHMYGVMTLTVADATGDQSVSERMVLGKVVSVRKRGQAVVVPSLFRRLFSMFKKS